MIKALNLTIKKGYTTVSLLLLLIQVGAQTPIPPKGKVFNESIMMVDSVTGRVLLRLTQYRGFYLAPTYHIHTGFSADCKSMSMVFAPWNTNGESALMLGNI